MVTAVLVVSGVDAGVAFVATVSCYLLERPLKTRGQARLETPERHSLIISRYNR
jgi:hypothetical protein